MNYPSPTNRYPLGLALGFLFSALPLAGCKKSEEAPQTAPSTAPSQPPREADRSKTAHPTAAATSTMRPSTRPGRLEPLDVLLIRVLELNGPGTESRKLVRVSAAGMVQPMYLNASAHVAGLTNVEAEAAIANAYRKSNLLPHPIVLVRRLRVGGADEDTGTGSLGNFDLVRVTVGDVAGPDTETVALSRLNGDGALGLPFIGPQKLAGLSEAEAEKLIVRAYADQNILPRAAVSVFRIERAPDGAAGLALPDAPIAPVPDYLYPYLQDRLSPSPLSLPTPTPPLFRPR